MKSRDIAIAGIVTALQIITLLISYIIPTIKLALLFAASVYPGVLLRIGVKRRTVASSFLASAALAVFFGTGARDTGGVYSFIRMVCAAARRHKAYA